jgi:HlyD family secretion protein
MKFTLKSLIWGTLAIALALALFFLLNPQPIDVEVAVVRLAPFKVTVRDDGRTRIREKYIVSAPVAGRLSRIELKVGDHCSENTLLAVILPSDPAILDARARAEATARMHAAETALQRAASNAEQTKIAYELNAARFERAQRLLPANAISADEFDNVRTEYLASAQAVKTARFDEEITAFELDMARAAVSQFTDVTPDSSVTPFEIFSPISGRVLRVFEESSTVVAVGEPLVELGDPQDLEIVIDVLSTSAVRINPGAELSIEHWGGDIALKGHVRVIEPQAFTKISSLGVEEQRVNVIADFDEPSQRLSPLGDGYRVEALIAIEQLEEALQIPNSALFRYETKWHVLVERGGRAVLQRVEIGLQNERQSQVLSGLAEGEQVVIYPSDDIPAGSRISASQTAR